MTPTQGMRSFPNNQIGTEKPSPLGSHGSPEEKIDYLVSVFKGFETHAAQDGKLKVVWENMRKLKTPTGRKKFNGEEKKHLASQAYDGLRKLLSDKTNEVKIAYLGYVFGKIDKGLPEEEKLKALNENIKKKLKPGNQ